MPTDFKSENHFVPQSYLRRWSPHTSKVWVYRLLVSHSNVPVWKEQSIRGIAKHQHLYTRLASGKQSDEFERWVEREIESPAAECIEKAVSAAQLTAMDWRLLIRFLAVQDLRTPAAYVRLTKQWEQKGPRVLDRTMRELERHLKEVSAGEGDEEQLPTQPVLRVPMKTELLKPDPHSPKVELRTEVLLGRTTWLEAVRYLTTSTVRVLYKHRWTILLAPDGLQWFTSDNPVLRLNYMRDGEFNRDGGWGSKGTKIYFPLSPLSLMYTQVGSKPPARGTVLSRDRAEKIQSFLVRNAHRCVFSITEDANIESLRKRITDADLVRQERRAWETWNEEQTAAEREFE